MYILKVFGRYIHKNMGKKRKDSSKDADQALFSEFEKELTHKDFENVEDEYYRENKPDVLPEDSMEEEEINFTSPWLDNMDETMAGEEFEEELPVVVVPREEWSERPTSEKMTPLKKPVEKIHIHFTSGTKECWSKEQCIQRVRQIQDRDMLMFGYKDISYNWLVGGDGNVYEGRGWNWKPTLCLENPELNYEKMIDITYIGEWETKTHPFSMYTTYINWLRESINKHLVIEDYDLMLR